MFHYGHVRMLQRARQIGDTLVVGVVRDQDAEVYKRTPVMTLDERMEVVRACKYVNETVVAKLVVDQAFLQEPRIDLVVHGNDSMQAEFYSVPLEMGIMRYIPYTNGISTTDIIARVTGAGKGGTRSATPGESGESCAGECGSPGCAQSAAHQNCTEP